MPKRKHDKPWDWEPQIKAYNIKVLTEKLEILITPSTKVEIKQLLAKGVFPNLSEFGRYAVRALLDKYYEIAMWRKKLK